MTIAISWHPFRRLSYGIRVVAEDLPPGPVAMQAGKWVPHVIGKPIVLHASRGDGLYYVPKPDELAALGQIGDPATLSAARVKGWLQGRGVQISEEDSVETALEAIKAKIGVTAKPAGNSLELLPDDAMMTHVDIAKRLHLEPEALRKRLDRWRKANGDGWQETVEPKQNEPKYVYQIGRVRALLEEAVASA